MNAQPKSKFSISAKYLGPVLSLDGVFTENNQNLIFARNGTGKSFLSRALRYLDLHAQGTDITEAPINLVSEESPNGKGQFLLSRGEKIMGSLKLCKRRESVSVQASDTIFHVFSEDFVEQELRQKSYEINGEIENQIAIDSDNIKIKDAEKELSKARQNEEQSIKNIQDKFEANQASELHIKCGINKQLKEYKNIDLGRLILRLTEKPALPDRRSTEILNDLDSLKSIPSEPSYPEIVGLVSTDDIDINALSGLLEKITSPSSVSETIKHKIEAHHTFYETGKTIIQDEERTACPFCEQGIVAPDPKAIVDAYIKYFDDEEEKHKSKLRAFYKSLKNKETELTQQRSLIAKQKTRYDDLKRFIPSKKDSELLDCEQQIESACKAILSYESVIKEKAKALSTAYTLQEKTLFEAIDSLCKIIEQNNSKVRELTATVEKSDEERKALQRQACEVYEMEFAIENWNEIDEYKRICGERKTRKSELLALEKSAPSSEARVRVADTFELLIREFFADKYIFDKEGFVLKRGDIEMARGAHRTLSDGEKTAIAFCYFIACMHRKVSTSSDYKKLFLVFDDPVTSMSYDYVFSIAQTLKNMSISKMGEISINPGVIDGNKYVRPELLILTHSTYFFNIALSNKVVNNSAAFALHNEGIAHKISRLMKYVAPFQQQLKDIYEVANGKEPDHGTGNAVRSVLEAVGRFCRPDKAESLANFISYLASEDGILIKSVLINSLCHGSYYEEIPPPDDLKLACEEALKVVELYAAGQLEVIKSDLSVTPQHLKAVA